MPLLVEDQGNIVGHILFTPVTVNHGGHQLTGIGLAPMAVASNRQHRGIGTALVEHGLGLLRERGCPFVIVLDHRIRCARYRDAFDAAI